MLGAQQGAPAAQQMAVSQQQMPAGATQAQTQQLVPKAKKPQRRVLTSLTLQIFVYFGAWWDVFYYVLNILVFVYKGLTFPYPSRNFSMEFSFSWLWILIEAPRLFLVTKGNKTEHASPLFFAMVLAAPLLAMYIYFINWQTYVLKIDLFTNGVALGFIGVQLLFSIFSAIQFIVTTRFKA